MHHGAALAFLLDINALRASEAAAVRIEDYAETLRGHRVLHLVGKGSKPATMAAGRAGDPRPGGLSRATDRRATGSVAAVREADPRTTEHYDRARGNLDRHGVHYLTAYVAGV